MPNRPRAPRAADDVVVVSFNYGARRGHTTPVIDAAGERLAKSGLRLTVLDARERPGLSRLPRRVTKGLYEVSAALRLRAQSGATVWLESPTLPLLPIYSLASPRSHFVISVHSDRQLQHPFVAYCLRLFTRLASRGQFVTYDATVAASLGDICSLDVNLVLYDSGFALGRKAPPLRVKAIPGRILQFGSLRRDKDVLTPVGALAYLPDHYHLRVRGQDVDGLHEHILAAAHEYGVRDRVEIELGYVEFDDVQLEFVHSQVVACLYRDGRGQHESGVAVDAMRAGRPVVAAGLRALGARIASGVQPGVWLEHVDPRAFADAVLELERGGAATDARRFEHEDDGPETIGDLLAAVCRERMSRDRSR